MKPEIQITKTILNTLLILNVGGSQFLKIYQAFHFIIQQPQTTILKNKFSILQKIAIWSSPWRFRPDFDHFPEFSTSPSIPASQITIWKFYRPPLAIDPLSRSYNQEHESSWKKGPVPYLRRYQWVYSNVNFTSR